MDMQSFLKVFKSKRAPFTSDLLSEIRKSQKLNAKVVAAFDPVQKKDSSGSDVGGGLRQFFVNAANNLEKHEEEKRSSVRGKRDDLLDGADLDANFI